MKGKGISSGSNFVQFLQGAFGNHIAYNISSSLVRNGRNVLHDFEERNG